MVDILNWKGKRSFTETQYYPAQLKESFGSQDQDGWINKLFWGDNLQVMNHLLKEYRGKVKLIYMDPPFDTKLNFRRKIQLKGKNDNRYNTSFEEKQYTDIWTNDDYLQFMYERLSIAYELLSDNGTLYLHCDWHRNYLLRILLDEIFTPEKFQSEIIWKRTDGHNLSGGYDMITDTIFMYSKTERFTFNQQYEELSNQEMKHKFPHIEPETGRRYNHEKLEKNFNFSSAGKVRVINGKEVISDIGWVWTQKTFDKRLKENPNIIHWTTTGRPRYKNYADEYKGRKISNLWTDIKPLAANTFERVDYPTQKPEQLLERIIKSSSHEGDIVFDAFMGSGTTLVAALKLGRRFIGADVNFEAVQTTTKRLIKLNDPMINNPKKMVGFQIYNVNDYHYFKNPIQARESLVKLLGIRPFPYSSPYDGERDGRLVKFMPINRRAIKTDLSELIRNFDYNLFEERKRIAPNEPVEKLLIVCMGCDKALKKNLMENVPYLLDVEVLDISDYHQFSQFNSSIKANIKLYNNKLIIESFYSVSLAEKIGFKEGDISNWRELVDSIMIDWNYDGKVLRPGIVDIPNRNQLVKGAYLLPEEVGTIKIKITDLLSESYEEELKPDIQNNI